METLANVSDPLLRNEFTDFLNVVYKHLPNLRQKLVKFDLVPAKIPYESLLTCRQKCLTLVIVTYTALLFSFCVKFGSLTCCPSAHLTWLYLIGFWPLYGPTVPPVVDWPSGIPGQITDTVCASVVWLVECSPLTHKALGSISGTANSNFYQG